MSYSTFGLDLNIENEQKRFLDVLKRYPIEVINCFCTEPSFYKKVYLITDQNKFLQSGFGTKDGIGLMEDSIDGGIRDRAYCYRGIVKVLKSDYEKTDIVPSIDRLEMLCKADRFFHAQGGYFVEMLDIIFPEIKEASKRFEICPELKEIIMRDYAIWGAYIAVFKYMAKHQRALEFPFSKTDRNELLDYIKEASLEGDDTLEELWYYLKGLDNEDKGYNF